MVNKKEEKKKSAKTAKKTQEAKFAKEQLITSKRFSLSEQSFLEVVLKDDMEYTIKEARDALSAQFKRKVDK